MKTFVLLFIALFCFSSLFASFVPLKDAEKAAKSYYYQGINSISTKSWEDISLTSAVDLSDNIQYYVFNVNGNEGFIVVSAESTVSPILAYSFEGAFNANNMSPGQQAFMDFYADEIILAQNLETLPNAKAISDWTELLSFNPVKGFKQKTTVGPFILANWNQDWPYNAQCPADVDGDHGHVYVGCVATAMVQVMKYYNYPAVGEGSKTHISWMNGGYGNITVDFSQQSYDWYAMPNQLSGENDEVAKINFHAGVAVSMYWGADGSGSQTSKIVTALENYFRYDSDCQLVTKSAYTSTAWNNLLRAQLNQGKPMVYSGESTTVGHAWNCDGYQDDDKFHMNWGWGGAGNGYYTLDNLVSTATPGGPENDFSTGQEAVINIYPENNYPTYCSGTMNLTGVEGSFGDGSSNTLYQNNQNCVYVIEPECGAVVQLEFDSFDLGAGDAVYVYDGNSTDDEIIDVYDADNVPPSSLIIGSKGALTLEFNTDGSSAGAGWDVTYNTRNCKTNIIYADPDGTINDGSGPCDYSNSLVCSWFIQPEGAEWISLNFSEFDLAGSIDFVKVFKGELNGELVGDFNANTTPTGQIMVEDGVAVIQFFADSNNAGTGWTVDYNSSVTAVEQNQLISGLQLYPNPSNGDSELAFYLTQNEIVEISITDMPGKVLVNSNMGLAKGHHHMTISSLLGTNPSPGVYFVNLIVDGSINTSKLVVVE
jgi:hypothetical protein